jgi:hypothetical protein
MTLVYASGFDLFGSASDAQLDTWSTNGGGGGGITDVQTTNGRGAGACLRVQRGNGGGNNPIAWQRTITALTGASFVGCAYQAVSAATAQRIVALLDSGSVQIELDHDTVGTLTLYRGTTLLATSSAAAFSFSTYHYVEIAYTPGAASNGSVTVKLDGSVIFALTAVTTQQTGNASWNQILLGGAGTVVNQSNTVDFRYDDLAICSNAGTVNNTNLGDVRIIGQVPNAAGTLTNLTKVGASATNWQSVGQIPTDGDTTYVASGTVGTTDTYKYASLPSNTSSVLAVIGRPVARKDDAGARTITSHVRSNGTEADAPTTSALATSYAYLSQIMELNPTTGAAWSVTDANAMEIGPKVAA